MLLLWHSWGWFTIWKTTWTRLSSSTMRSVPDPYSHYPLHRDQHPSKSQLAVLSFRSWSFTWFRFLTLTYLRVLVFCRLWALIPLTDTSSIYSISHSRRTQMLTCSPRKLYLVMVGLIGQRRWVSKGRKLIGGWASAGIRVELNSLNVRDRWMTIVWVCDCWVLW